jgi:hypothetical protein
LAAAVSIQPLSEAAASAAAVLAAAVSIQPLSEAAASAAAVLAEAVSAQPLSEGAVSAQPLSGAVDFAAEPSMVSAAAGSTTGADLRSVHLVWD